MVVRLVDVEVDAEVEVMVMICRHQVWRDQRAVRGVLRSSRVVHRRRCNALHRIKAGCPDHDPDLAILLQAIVDQIVIVSDFGGGAYNELARWAAFRWDRLSGVCAKTSK